MTLTIIVIAITASRSSVVAAFLLFGLRNAGTPLEIASTPVSAAQPEEKARASRNISANVVRESELPTPGSGVMVRSALATSGRSPAASRSSP